LSAASLRRVLDVVGDEGPDRGVNHQRAPHLRVEIAAGHELRHELDRFERLLGKILVAIEPFERLAQRRDASLRHTRRQHDRAQHRRVDRKVAAIDVP
jgi:hypothetical protein